VPLGASSLNQTTQQTQTTNRQTIRDLLDIKNFVVVVEHDLSVLDYLSDFICCLYGKPGAYGVVTLPFSVREGINIFLAGAFGRWRFAVGAVVGMRLFLAFFQWHALAK